MKTVMIVVRGGRASPNLVCHYELQSCKHQRCILLIRTTWEIASIRIACSHIKQFIVLKIGVIRDEDNCWMYNVINWMHFLKHTLIYLSCYLEMEKESILCLTISDESGVIRVRRRQGPKDVLFGVFYSGVASCGKVVLGSGVGVTSLFMSQSSGCGVALASKDHKNPTSKYKSSWS